MVEFTEWPEIPGADFANYPPRKEKGMKLTHTITIRDSQAVCTHCHVSKYWKLAIYIHENFFCSVLCFNAWAEKNGKQKIQEDNMAVSDMILAIPWTFKYSKGSIAQMMKPVAEHPFGFCFVCGGLRSSIKLTVRGDKICHDCDNWLDTG